MNTLTWLLSWCSDGDLLQVTEFAFWLALSTWAGLLTSQTWLLATKPEGGPPLSKRTLALAGGATVTLAPLWLATLAHLFPGTWLYVRQALWLVGMTGALGLALLTAASWLVTKPSTTDTARSVTPALLGATSGAVALMSYSFYLGFRYDPTAWFSSPSWHSALATPWTRELFALTLCWSTFVGLSLSGLSTTSPRPPGLRSLPLVCAALGAALLVTQPLWLPTWLNPTHLAQALASGVGRDSLASRAAVAASVTWIVSAWLLSSSQRHLPTRWPLTVRSSVVTLLLITGWLIFVSLNAQRGPWSLGRQVYANGMRHQYLRINRRLPRATAPSWSFDRASARQRRVVGETVLSTQCGSCHALRGASSVKQIVTSWTDSQLDQFLQRQREGERLGHEYRRIMPPLAGSDDEVRALETVLKPTGTAR